LKLKFSSRIKRFHYILQKFCVWYRRFKYIFIITG